MSTIEEVRAAETRVQELMDALRKAEAGDLNHLSDELKTASDEYARAVRELKATTVKPRNPLSNKCKVSIARIVARGRERCANSTRDSRDRNHIVNGS